MSWVETDRALHGGENAELVQEVAALQAENAHLRAVLKGNGWSDSDIDRHVQEVANTENKMPLRPRIVPSVVTYGAYEDPI